MRLIDSATVGYMSEKNSEYFFFEGLGVLGAGFSRLSLYPSICLSVRRVFLRPDKAFSDLATLYLACDRWITRCLFRKE
jgi:hypothetical protein